jgi:hemoglobin/transferrin/lactoferrin receptor protein
MNKLYLLFFSLLISSSITAQKVYFKDATTQLPISEVSVLNKNNNSFLRTSWSGIIDIKSWNLSDSIKIIALGYEIKSDMINKLLAPNNTIFLTPTPFNLDELVVSVNKFENKKLIYPHQVLSISASNIKAINPATSATLLQNTGKVFTQFSQAGGGSPSLRGYEANKVLLVIDGVRMNNAIYRGGHLQNLITINPNMLSKVEVLFGPSAVIYGSDAFGGVISLYTKEPVLGTKGETNFEVNASSKFASAINESSSHLNFNVGLNKVAFLSAINFSSFGDVKQGNNRSKNYPDFGKRLFYQDRLRGRDTMLTNNDLNLQKSSDYIQIDLMQKIYFKPSEKYNHGLNLQYSTSSDIDRYDRLTEYRNGKLRFAEWYYGPQKRFLSAYNFNAHFTSPLINELKLTTAYQKIEESRITRNFNSNDLNSREENLDVFTFNADASTEIKRNKLSYGLETTYNKVKSIAYQTNIANGAVSSLDTRYPDGGSKMYSLAFYANNLLEVSNRFFMNQGLRFSYVGLDANFSDKSFFPFPFNTIKQRNNALNGNLGFTYLPRKDWKIGLLASTGFRAPNVDDLSKIFESVPGKVIFPNPNLKPEFTYNLELNFSKSIKNNLQLEGGVFRTWYANAIALRPSTYNNQEQILYNTVLSDITTSKNIDKAFIYGFYIDIKSKLTQQISLNSVCNYTYGRLKQNQGPNTPLDHISPSFGKTAIDLSFKKVKTSFYALYNGTKKLEDYSLSGEDNLQYATETGMPKWFTLNINSQMYLSRNLNLQLGLENILDKNYRVFASGISSPGRNLIITLNGNF